MSENLIMRIYLDDKRIRAPVPCEKILWYGYTRTIREVQRLSCVRKSYDWDIHVLGEKSLFVCIVLENLIKRYTRGKTEAYLFALYWLFLGLEISRGRKRSWFICRV